MASREHQDLATFIKNVHQSLRARCREVGAKEAWSEHCSQSETLQKYAEAMRILASKYWEENAKDSGKGAHSRVQWVVEKCLQYFTRDRAKEDSKEERSVTKLQLLELNETFENNHCDINETDGIYLLDVGSCYNPFGIYPFFKVLPVDLAPATPDVHHCDFLNVDIKTKGSVKKIDYSCSITELEFESFDVVVFSLLLEYLPSPTQRYACAVKAYSVLKAGGLLFIITPDSKHSTANSPLMKAWRIVLAELGFSRVYYEKLPHIHCMSYRKCRVPQVAKQWALKARQKQGEQSFMVKHEMSSQGLYIPQDLQKICAESDVHSAVERTSVENKELVEMFHCLPEDYS